MRFKKILVFLLCVIFIMPMFNVSAMENGNADNEANERYGFELDPALSDLFVRTDDVPGYDAVWTVNPKDIDALIRENNAGISVYYVDYNVTGTNQYAVQTERGENEAGRYYDQKFLTYETAISTRSDSYSVEKPVEEPAKLDYWTWPGLWNVSTFFHDGRLPYLDDIVETAKNSGEFTVPDTGGLGIAGGFPGDITPLDGESEAEWLERVPLAKRSSSHHIRIYQVSVDVRQYYFPSQTYFVEKTRTGENIFEQNVLFKVGFPGGDTPPTEPEPTPTPTPTPTPVPTPPPGAVTVELSLVDSSYTGGEITNVDYIAGSLGLNKYDSFEQQPLTLSALFLSTYPVEVTNINTIMTAPEGFSFSPNSLVQEYNVPVFSLPAGSAENPASDYKDVAVYPLYSELYETKTSATFEIDFPYDAEQAGDDYTVTVAKPDSPVTEGLIVFDPPFNGGKFQATWDLSDFTDSNTIYNPDLSAIGVTLNKSVYNERLITQSLTNFGFTNIKTDEYSFFNNPFVDRVAYAFAQKKVVVNENGEDKVKTLVAVILRGTDPLSLRELLSDVKVRSLTSFFMGDKYRYHAGLYLAAKDINKRLQEYISSAPADTKLFITGYSRGASVANILAQQLDDSENIAEIENIYAYTYAPINVVYSEGKPYGYDNIFNIMNNADPVPKLYPEPTYFVFGQDYYYSNPVRSEYSFLGNLNHFKNYGTHLLEAYMEWLTSTPNPNDWHGKAPTIGGLDHLLQWLEMKCPVDIEVYDASNNLVGKISNSDVSIQNDDNILIFVDGDIKNVLYPQGEGYTVKITGTDIGTLDYNVTLCNGETFETIESKDFTDVALYDGKEMRSEETVNGVEFFVIEGENIVATINEDGTETVLASDGAPGVSPGAIVVELGDTNTFNLSLGTAETEYAETAYVKSEDVSITRIITDAPITTTSGAAITVSQPITVSGEAEGDTEITVEFDGGNYTGEKQRTVTVIVVDKADVTFIDEGDTLLTSKVTKGKPLGMSQWPDVPTKDGYAFDGWYTGPDGGGDPFEISTVINGDTEVYAAWLELPEDTPPPQDETYRINVSAGTGGTVSGGGTYNEGASVTLAAEPNRNYRFNGWYENGSRISGAGTIYVFTAERDRNLEARFSYSPPDDGNDDDDDDNDNNNNNNRRNDRDRDNDDNNSSSTNIWTGVNDRITNAKTGETVTVNTNNNTAVPTNLINAVKGKDINFVVNVGTYSWTINGLSVQTIPSNLTYYNLSVSKIINAPISALAGNKDVALLELPHKGVFPFTPVLEWRLGETHKDSTLFLYYYNETNKTLEYLYEFLTDAKGNAKLTLTQGGKYALVSEKLTGGATEELPEATEPPVAEPEPTQTHTPEPTTPEPTTPEPTPTPQPTPAPVVPQAPAMLVLNENMPADELGFRPFMFMSLESVGYKYGVIRVKDVLTFMNAQSTWDNATGSATITGTDRNGMPLVIVLTNNSPTMTVNGATYDIAEYSGAPDLRGLYTTYNAGGALYLPCRAIANAFGVSLEWNGETSTAIIRK